MPRKVLFAATVVRGHIAAFHLPYLKWFHDNGFEVHVASADDTGGDPIPYCDVFHPIPFDRRPFSPRNIKAYRRLRRVMEQEQFTLVHCHTPVGGVLARLAAAGSRKNGTKVIYTAHGFAFYHGAPPGTALFRSIERLCARLTDLIITINREDAAYAEKHLPCRTAYVHGVGVDEAIYHPSKEKRESARTALGIPADRFMLLTVGRLDRNKNQETAIRAAADLIHEGGSLFLLIVGEGARRKKLETLAAKLGIRESVRFLGYRADIPALLCAADAYIHLSHAEGLPRAVLEAMASELPVIASDARGNRELVDQNGGFLCPVTDHIAVSRAIRVLAENPALREKLGAYNRTKIFPYTLENTLREMSACYRSVLNPPTRVLHVLSSRLCYGAEHVVCDMMEQFRHDSDIEMAYASPDGEIAAALAARDLSYFPMKTFSRSELKRIIRTYHPDIIHAHDVRAGVLASLCGKGTKLISTMHVNNPAMRKKSIKSILYAAVSRRFSRIFWVNHSAMTEFAFAGLVAGKSEHLANIVFLPSIRAKAETAYAAKHTQYDGVYIGRLEPQKDPLRLVRILAAVICRLPDARFAIIGDGALLTEAKQSAAALGIGKNIDFLGYMENPYGVLAKARVLLMCSRFEGLPMVILEAGALGVPVVSVPTDGIREVITDGENGFLSNSDDTLAARAAALISDDALHMRMHRAALSHAEETNDGNLYKNRLRAAYFS